MPTSACNCDASSFLVDSSGNQLMSFNPLRATNPFNLSVSGHTMAPYVILHIDDNNIITMGNKSQGNNTPYAAIKSFQFGISDGFNLTFEIVDVQGGNFCTFINKLMKDLNDPNIASTTNQIKFEWGIYGFDCNGNIVGSRKSCLHTAFLTYITPIYDNGLFTFTLTCVDLSDVYQQQTADKDFSAGGVVTLTDAIQTLFKKYTKPPVDKILYQMRDANGDIINAPNGWEDVPGQPFFDSNNGQNSQMTGPKKKWPAAGRTPQSVLQDWLRQVVSINGKGFTFAIQAGTNRCSGLAGSDAGVGNVLIIRENDKPGCTESSPDVAPGRRIYIVNGGRASQVISFIPHIRWTFIQSSKAGGFQVKNVQKDNPQDKFQDCTDDNANPDGAKLGQTTTQEINDSAEELSGADSPRAIIQAEKLQFLADNAFSPITAELIIQGDPSYDSFLNIGQFITIVVINPFIPSSSPLGCDWTIQTISGNNTNCNSILSHAEWMIKGISHAIRDGSYRTILELVLATPGVDTSFLLGI